MLTKNALGNLINRYKSVLKKCNLINIFGTMAVVLAIALSSGAAFAADNPAGNTITSGGMNANTLGDPILNNYGTILGGHLFTESGANDSMAAMWGNGNMNYIFTNRGDITISYTNPATGASYAQSYAYGMHANGTGNHRLYNYGSINVTATGGTAIPSSTNTADADSSARGMYATGTGNHSLNNYGKITVTSTAGTATSTGSQQTFATSYAYGMHADGVGNHSLNNYDSIYVTGIGGKASGTIDPVGAGSTAYGMYAAHFTTTGNHSLNNHGNITVMGTGGTAIATSGGTANASAYIYGMAADSHGGSVSVNNYGRINVIATGGTATSAGSATAIASAHGIHVFGAPAIGVEHLINNYGIITASATAAAGQPAHAIEAFGFHSYSVGTFATFLRNWTIDPTNMIADTVFGINVSAGNAVNFKNTRLILRPGTAAQGFEFGKTYNVKDMIAVIDWGTGAVTAANATHVTGTIAEAIAEVPFLTATLTNGNDPLNATVSLDINEDVSSAAAQGNLAVVQGQMSNITRQLLQTTYDEIYKELVADSGTGGMAAGSSVGANKWQVFLSPYGNTMSNSAYDLNGNSMGITAGGNYRVNDKLTLGAHFDFNAAKYYVDSMDAESDTTSFALGLHGIYKILPEWYVRGQLTGSLSQTNSYYDRMDAILPASADSNYNGEALYIALNTGYVWTLADGHTLTPEVGLSYLGTHTSSYDIKWGGPTMDSLGGLYNLKYDDAYYSALYGNINLNWRSQWDLQNDSSIALLAGLGLRQNLSGSEVESKLRIAGTGFTARSSEDMSTWLADVGVEYRYGNFSVSLNYDGSYGTKQTVHGGNVMLKLEF